MSEKGLFKGGTVQMCNCVQVCTNVHMYIVSRHMTPPHTEGSGDQVRIT